MWQFFPWPILPMHEHTKKVFTRQVVPHPILARTGWHVVSIQYPKVYCMPASRCLFNFKYAVFFVHIMHRLSWKLGTVCASIQAMEDDRPRAIMEVWWYKAFVWTIERWLLVILKQIFVLNTRQIVFYYNADCAWESCFLLLSWQEAVFKQLILGLGAVVGVNSSMVAIISKCSCPSLWREDIYLVITNSISTI